MMNSYATICKEVLVVLKKLPKNQLMLIPNDIIEYIKFASEKSKEEVVIKFDGYGNPILSDEAKSMIILIYQKYFLDDSIRALLIDKLIINDREKQEKAKRKLKNDVFYN